MKNSFKTLFYAGLFTLPAGAFAQAFSENMGNAPSTIAIATHDANNGFQNSTPFAFTGTGDMRNTDASTTSTLNGYPLASGGANAFISNSPAGKSFQISGINTTGLTSPVLSFGIRKSTNNNDGSELVLEASTDGITFSALSYPALPATGTGNAHWYYRTTTTSVPSGTNVTLRWKNTNTSGLTTQYRIDDVSLTGGTPSPTCSASMSVTGGLSCGAGSATLTAISSTTGSTYLWAPGGATTQEITATTAGVYNVTITTVDGCTSTAQYALNSTPGATVVATASSASVCAGSQVTLCAQSVASDLFISEYSEGAIGNEKYIEIFNGTNAVATLTNYVYEAYHNGASVPTFTVNLATFQPTLGIGSVLVLRNPGSTVAVAGSYTTNAVAHNGNDALAIRNLVTSSFADVFGAIGSDPGSAGWNASGSRSTVDRTLRRKSDVYSGVTTSPASGFPTLLAEWDPFFDTDQTGLGSHALNATTYSWMSGTSTTTDACVVATVTAPTVYTVTTTYSTSGCSATTTVAVGVYGAPTSTIDASVSDIFFCFGDQCSDLTISASNGTAPYTYLWSNGSTSTLVAFCPTVAGTYDFSVTVTDFNGCTVNKNIAINVVDACCEGTNVIVCTGTETTCATPELAEILINEEGGTPGPCPEFRKMALQTSNSVARNTASILNVYPNPFVDAATFEVNVASNSSVKIEVMDYTGKKVAEINNSVVDAGNYKFNWNGNNANGETVASGLYLCKITSGSTVQTVKVQKLSK